MSNINTNRKIVQSRNFSKDELLIIGNKIASLWGGNCYNCYYNKDTEKYIFECIEHGEDFIIELSESELYKDYI